MPFREGSSGWSSVEKPGGGCRGCSGALQQRGGRGGRVSSSHFPTVPFKAVNFHFRGRSMSVTATLVLLSKVCEGASAWEEFINHLRETFLNYFAHF